MTIDVISENGAQSFSPNPATLPAGQMVVWHNIDSVTHRVVLNNGSLDTGDLRPGASSQAMSINAGGGAYHCSIHPSMVGTIQPVATDLVGLMTNADPVGQRARVANTARVANLTSPRGWQSIEWAGEGPVYEIDIGRARSRRGDGHCGKHVARGAG